MDDEIMEIADALAETGLDAEHPVVGPTASFDLETESIFAASTVELVGSAENRLDDFDTDSTETASDQEDYMADTLSNATAGNNDADDEMSEFEATASGYQSYESTANHLMHDGSAYNAWLMRIRFNTIRGSQSSSGKDK